MRILLVGLGGMGRVHFINSQKIPEYSIAAAVGSGEADRQTAEGYGLAFYSSIAEACSREHFDAADITTPTFLHKEHVLQALEAGLDVVVEKPLALSSRDAREIFEFAEKRHKRVFVAQVLRYTKEYSAVIDLVRSGKYGRVADAVFTRLSSWPSWSKDSWLCDRKKSGLVPFDLHIHDLDIIMAAFGEPESFRCTRRESCGYYLNAEYGYDGFTVRAEAGWIHSPIPFTACYRIIFEHGTLVYDGTSLKMYEEGGNIAEYDISYSVVISTGINVPPTGWYYEELKEIAKALERGEKSVVESDQIIRTLRLLEQM